MKRIRMVTPLFLCLVCIEISDVMFSFDSVPAVIAVTQEPFLIYSAMIFAILGLRSMYFVLASLEKYLTYLGTAVIGVLAFIGVKLIYQSADEIFQLNWIDISATMSMYIVLGLLGIGVIASLLRQNTLPMD